MDMNRNNLLTPNEVSCILIGIMLDINVFTLANSLVKTAKQDSWIAATIGAIYPLYVALVAIYVSNKFPKDNILILSKRYLGNIVGTVLNFLFLLSFFSYFPAGASQLVIISRTYTVPFISSLKLYIVIMIIGAYVAYKGLNVIKRICLINFYILISIFVISIFILGQGSFLNVSPVFASGAQNILTASIDSAYDYSLMELIFLIYPFINDSTKIKSSTLKSLAFICIMYTWITFISIYYLGIDIIPKTFWSFLPLARSIKFGDIANFRYLILFFTIIISLKSICILYYVTIFILDDIKKLKTNKIIYLIVAIIVIYISNKYYSNLLDRNEILKYTAPISVIYNLLYISFISFFIFIKKDEKSE